MDAKKRHWITLLISMAITYPHQLVAEAWTKEERVQESISPSTMVLETDVTPSGAPLSSKLMESGQNEISMIEAVRSAVNWNPSIYESIGGLYQQRESLRSARSGYFPQISVNLVAGHDTENKNSGDGNAVQLYISQMIYDFGKVSSEVDRETANSIKSQAEVLESIDRVTRDTAKAAVEVQRYQALLKAAQKRISGVSSIGKLVTMRSSRGVGSRSDVLQAQSRMEAAKASKEQVLAKLYRWRSTLESLTGVRGIPKVSAEVPVSIKSSCQEESPRISMVPEVIIAKATRAEALARMEEAKSNSWPTLSLDASVNSYLDQQYVDVNALNQNESAVFLNLSMPIYQGGRISAGKRGASYALQAANAAIDSARISVIRKYRAAREQAHGLQGSLSILNARERAIFETRGLYRKQYSSLGTRTLLDLLNAEQELYQARVEKENTEYDLVLLQIDCLYNRGKLRDVFELEGNKIQGVEVLP